MKAARQLIGAAGGQSLARRIDDLSMCLVFVATRRWFLMAAALIAAGLYFLSPVARASSPLSPLRPRAVRDFRGRQGCVQLYWRFAPRISLRAPRVKGANKSKLAALSGERKRMAVCLNWTSPLLRPRSGRKTCSFPVAALKRNGRAAPCGGRQTRAPNGENQAPLRAERKVPKDWLRREAAGQKAQANSYTHTHTHTRQECAMSG